MPLKRNVVVGFDDGHCGGERRVGIADDVRPLARRRRRAAHVGEQIL
jgi:hypothetical protein